MINKRWKTKLTNQVIHTLLKLSLTLSFFLISFLTLFFPSPILKWTPAASPLFQLTHHHTKGYFTQPQQDDESNGNIALLQGI